MIVAETTGIDFVAPGVAAAEVVAVSAWACDSLTGSELQLARQAARAETQTMRKVGIQRKKGL